MSWQQIQLWLRSPIMAVIAGVAVPVVWAVLFLGVVGPVLNQVALACLATSAVGGLWMWGRVRRGIQGQGFPTGGVAFLTVLLTFFLPLVFLLWGASIAGSPPPPKGKDEKKVVPGAVDTAEDEDAKPWPAEELRQKYWLENAKLKGWVSSLPDADTVVATYEVPTTSEGPAMEAGVNVALMKGNILRMTCPEMDQLRQKVSVQLGEEGEWRVIHAEEDLTVAGDLGAVRVKVRTEGSSTTLPVSFTPVQQTTSDESRVLISTRGFGQAGRRKLWGLLPPTEQYDWKLYIRYTKADGAALPKSYLTKTPGSFLVVNEATGKKLIESSVTKNERIISSREVNATGKESLILHLPFNPGDEFRMDVKLLILPKGGVL